MGKGHWSQTMGMRLAAMPKHPKPNWIFFMLLIIYDLTELQYEQSLEI